MTPSAPPAPPQDSLPAWAIVAIVLGFLIVFPLWWSFIVWMIGMRWRRLAADFQTNWPPSPDAKVFSMQSCALGWTSYNRVMTVAITPTQLQMRPIAIFAVGHPPIGIPWDCFGEVRSAGFLKGFSLYAAKVRLPSGKDATIRLRREVWAASPLRIVD